MSFRTQPRDVWLISSARAVSVLGDQAALIALTLRLSDDGPRAVMLLLIAGLLPMLLMAPVSGRCADRFPARTLIPTTSAVQAVLCVGLAVVHTVPATLLLVAALGAGQSVNVTAWSVLLTRVSGAGLPSAMGLMQTLGTLASIGAPVLGATLTTVYGSAAAISVDAGSFLVLTVAARFIAGGAAPLQRVRSARRARLDDPLVLTVLVMAGTAILAGGMVNVVGVFLIRHTLNASGAWLGWADGVWGIGMVAGSVLAGRSRGDRRLAYSTSLGLIAIGGALLCYAAVPQVGWLLPFAVVGGLGNGILNVTVGSLVMGRAPAARQGQYAATITAVTNGAQVASFILGGALASAFAPRTVFAVAGAGAVLAPILLTRRLLATVGPVAVRPVAVRPVAVRPVAVRPVAVRPVAEATTASPTAQGTTI